MVRSNTFGGNAQSEIQPQQHILPAEARYLNRFCKMTSAFIHCSQYLLNVRNMTLIKINKIRTLFIQYLVDIAFLSCMIWLKWVVVIFFCKHHSVVSWHPVYLFNILKYCYFIMIVFVLLFCYIPTSNLIFYSWDGDHRLQAFHLFLHM